MSLAEWNEVLASPFDPPAITSNIKRIVLVNCLGLRPKYDLSSKRAVSQREVLILSTDDIGIKSTYVLKQISRNGHICGSTEILDCSGTGDFGYDTVFKRPPKPDKRSRHRPLRKANRPDNQRFGPPPVRSYVLGEEIPAHPHIIVDKNQYAATGGLAARVSCCRSLEALQPNELETRTGRAIRQFDRWNRSIIDHNDFVVCGRQVLLDQ